MIQRNCSSFSINLIYLILLALFYTTLGRQFQKSFTFRQVRTNGLWLFLDKITLEEGLTQIKVQTHKQNGKSFGSSNQIFIDIVQQPQWQQQLAQKCNKQIKSPVIIHNLLLDGSTSISQLNLEVKKQHFYYFVLKDCNKRFLSEYSNGDMSIQIIISTNNNGSHLGEEQDHWFIIPVIVLVGLWLIFSDKKFMQHTNQSDIDYARLLFFAGVATNISSLFWKSIGFFIYGYYGVNFLTFHLIYLFMHAFSESIVISLIMLIGFGWSINYLNSQNMDLAMPLLALCVAVNIVVTLLTQLANSSHDMYHSFDAPAGTVLIVVRLVVGAIFLYGIYSTYQNSRHRVKNFMIYFGVLGFLYICSNPIIVSLANKMVSAQDRNQFVFITVQIIKSVCNIGLRYMIGSSKSEYNKLNYRNSSFLPTQGF